MPSENFKAIPVETIIPDIFPPLDLYTRGSGSNYVFYKPAERQLTEADRNRFERNGTKSVFIRSDDSVVMNRYYEKNMSDFLASERISACVKDLVLYQTSMEFVAEVLSDPEAVSLHFTRCEALVRNLARQISYAKNLMGAIEAIASDRLYILSHSVKVAALTMLVHEQLFNNSADEVIDVGIGGILHDLGMTFISSDILEKPEALSNIEYATVKTHPQKGYDFLRKAGLLSDISLNVVRHHHEKWDGTGYPSRLSGEAISRPAQVGAICDIYCALVSERPYRKASSHAETLQIMENGSGSAYKKELFEQFREVVNSQISD